MAWVMLQRAARMRRSKAEIIPDDVYIQFVRSLFDNAHMLVIGGGCYFVLGLMSYLRTHDALYLFFSCLLLSITLWRYVRIRAFHTSGGAIGSVDEARRWE